MKKIYYILFVLLACYACKNEDYGFSVSLPDGSFRFTPIAGGAVMHYKLSSDPSIVGLKVRYKDFKGDEILRSASSLCDTVKLVGFNEAKKSVPAMVTLCKSSGEESEPIPVTFDTQDSGPVAFFDHVQVRSGWNGFSVIYENPTNTSGMAHVFYLGTDPQTHKPDTLLVKSFNLEEGKDTLSFQLKQLQDLNTIIIRTEDFRGYMVKEKVWDKVASYNTAKIDPKQFDFYCSKSIEDDDDMLGAKYLFDGDIRGTGYYDDNGLVDHHFRTFLAGPWALGTPMYIDLRKSRLIAQLRLYAMLDNGVNLGKGNYTDAWGELYLNKIPCNVTVFAAKDDGNDQNWDNKKWVQISNFEQDPNLDGSLRWSAKCLDDYPRVESSYATKKEMQAADSLAINLNVVADGQGEGYRYLKIVVNKVFGLTDFWSSISGTFTNNELEYFTIQELEVYGKKDE